eukprot:TRINITY_DN14_c0_g2_i8.p1 TRINITY_DN14_c0_g2~~TRINITY_DN14_c0_g2_i8.p1  ORF type:complete len:707 (-),score=84.23 TRINITY_DN14_c0_g2_i8:390-2366(-)
MLDTGSSLIVAPSAVVSRIHEIVSQWVNQGGNCDDLSGLPDLEFALGGVKLALPAESYMGMARGQLASDVVDLMPRYAQQSTEMETCQPLIMGMDVDTEDGPLWILGMPFFRKYYTNFAFSESQAAVNMSFSVADDACKPGHQPADADLLFGRTHTQRRSQLHIDVSKIRMPDVFSRARASSKALNLFHGSDSHSIRSDEISETGIAAIQQPYRQRLTNHMDIQYTAQISTKGKEMSAVLDTGSFELFEFSQECSVCGNASRLYDLTWTQNARRTGIASFGSGTLFSVEVADDVTIGQIVSANLSFWAVTDANMPILQQGSFQAILGLGPPSSALKFAEKVMTGIRKELSRFIAQGYKLTPEITDIVARYEGNLAHAQCAVPFVKTIGLTSMSVCFLKESGSGGFHIWHDDAVRQQPSKFTTIPVVGDSYWSASMTHVGLGWSASGHVDPFHALGCSDRACSAVLDTGSTFISAPSAVVSEIHAIVSQWVNRGGDCDDLSSLPDLVFSLGGVKLSLPPESYMGKAYGQLASEFTDLMPNYVQQFQDIGTCQPLIMSLDLYTEEGFAWILGMPFFRKYYTNFAFSESQAAMNMSFSVADDACEPGEQPAGADFLSVGTQARRRAQLRVDVSNIRVPKVFSRKRTTSSALEFIRGNLRRA